MFLNNSMQAVVILACEKHAPGILEKIDNEAAGNWFVMPPTSTFRTGYWPNVSRSHADHGCAIFGFLDRQTLVHKLQEFSTSQMGEGLCPDCAAYEWGITPLHAALETRDPVCGKGVSCASALSLQHQGKLFFFCGVGCRDRFQQNPQNFVADAEEMSVAEVLSG